MKDYLIIYERADDGGWGAYCADVPGVIVAAETREETVRLMQEALSSHLEWLAERGEPVPEPRSEAGRLVA